MVLPGPSLTDEAGIIYVLEKVDSSLRSLTDEAGIIYVLEKVHGSLRSLTEEAGIICIWFSGEGAWFSQVLRRWIVLSH